MDADISPLCISPVKNKKENRPDIEPEHVWCGWHAHRLNYRPTHWLTVRPEVRYDNSEGRAFEGRHGLFTADFDVILSW